MLLNMKTSIMSLRGWAIELWKRFRESTLGAHWRE